MNQPTETLKADLNQHSGKLAWSELERHFARGVVLKVAVELDLIDVAVAMVENNCDTISGWVDHAAVEPVSTEDAKRWHDQTSTFWAVVVAPWVLIQECNEQ